jgi:chaperone BCS1
MCVQAPRPLDSVCLDSSAADDLVRDATEFFGSEDWYRRRGIPYRRGYLLHGPPGCGKTSFVCALAARLKLHICVLNLSARGLDDASLNARMHETPRDAVVLLEDVDAVFVARESADAEGGSSVTFSGLLNALDGVAAQVRLLLRLI